MLYNKLLTLFIILTFSNSVSGQKPLAKVDSLDIKKTDVILPHYLNESPTYPGGMKAWVTHIRKHIKPPSPPCEPGKVWVQFKVLKSGKTDSIQVKRGLCELADNNAIEAVKASGLWNPAYLNGKPIDSWTIIQLIFHYK